MLFVIMTTGVIPGYGGIKGPVLTPQPYRLSEVMQLVKSGVDVRLVQENGEYRRILFNDPLILRAMDKGHKGGVPEPEIGIIPLESEKKEGAKDKEVKEDKKLTEEEELAQLEEEIKELEKKEKDEKSFEVDELEEL